MTSNTLKKNVVYHFTKRKDFYSRPSHEYPFLNIVSKYYKPKYKTLEIGCGVGFFLARILNSSSKVLVGVDICKTLIHEAHTKFSKIDFLIGDAEKLPFKSECFKAVFMRNLLHHLVAETPNFSQRNMTKVLEEVRRVSDSEGDFFVLEQCILNRVIGWSLFWFSFLMAKLNLSFRRINLYERVVVAFLTFHQLIQLLEKTNFRVLIQYFHHPYTGLHFGLPFGDAIICAKLMKI